MPSNTERKEALRQVIAEVESVNSDLKEIFAKGLNTETPELFVGVVIPFKEKFESMLPQLKYKKEERKVLVTNLIVFFRKVKRNMSVPETLNAYEFFKKIRA